MNSGIEYDGAQAEFGRRVRVVRRHRALTLRDLAARCGLHWTYLGQLERGLRDPSLVTVLRVAAALRVDVAALLTGSEDDLTRDPRQRHAKRAPIEEAPELLGATVRRLRGERAWTQVELASATGLHRTYVGHIEQGRRNPSLSNLLLLAGALGVDVGQLVAAATPAG